MDNHFHSALGKPYGHYPITIIFYLTLFLMASRKLVVGGAEGVIEALSVRVWVINEGGGLFGDEAVGEEAVVLVVADDEVIEEVDVEDVAGLDEFGGYFFVGAAGFGVAGWVVVDDHDGVCVGEEGAFVDFAGVDE